MKTLFSTLLFTLCIAAQAQITSTFDSDADGWAFYNASSTLIAVTHNASNGNPGAYISATYASTTGSSNVNGNNQAWLAPTKFLGNHLVKSLGMNFKFDLQQSQAGTTSGYDVRIASGGNYIYFPLPVKPAVAPAWSSYSLPLDETIGWRYGSGTTIATRSQIIGILTNVTSITIRGTYATNAAYTSGLDNVVLEQRILAPAPVATTLSASTGKPGDIITITGFGFNTDKFANTVYFGGVKGTVESATNAQLQVTVPAGAAYGPLTIINTITGLSSKSATPFNPIFDGGGRVIPSSFKPKVDIPLTISIEGLVVKDIDGDGWDDLAVASNTTSKVIEIYRNLGLGGDITVASFAPKVTVTIPGTSTNTTGLQFVDLDGDGKLDAVTSNVLVIFGSAYFITYRNISTPGNIAFEAPEYWAGLTDDSSPNLVADIDGDGRPELIGGEGSFSTGALFWMAQNISTPGNIEFGASVSYFTTGSNGGFAGATLGDLDNDGKPEMLVTYGDRFSIFKNNSTPGIISLTDIGIITHFQYVSTLQVADFNLDGKNDLIWKRTGNAEFYIRINTNSGSPLNTTDFTTGVILSGDLNTYGGMSIADMNGDGKPDIIASDNGNVGVFENDYAGGVFDATAFISAYAFQGNGGSTYPTSPIVSDLNRDNKPDMIIGVTSFGRISIYENQNIHAPVISLNTVSPLKGAVGSTVTITGNNFSTTPVENIVWFGAVKATVLTAAENLLTVAVPAGATYAPVSVTKSGLTSRYHLPFQTTFGSGVTFDNTHFAPPVSYTLTGAGYNIEAGDLNIDGRVDILASAGNTAYAFRNDFTIGSITTTTLIANDTLSPTTDLFGNPRLEDFDGDGYLDVASTNTRIRKNITTGSNINFTANITYTGQGNLAYADFNQDGKMDIAVSNSGGAQLNLIENRTVPGNFTTTGTYGSFSSVFAFAKPGIGGEIVAADFDADGFPDVITVNLTTDNISIFRNIGGKRITAGQFTARVDIAVGDMPNRIYKGDFDSDGKLDLLLYHAVGTSSTLLIVLHNTSTAGNISFSRIDLTNPSATAVATIADLDGDGKPEILTTSESGNRFSIFKNIHTSGALTAASFAAPFNTTVTAPRGITTGDLNLDGKPEIIITRAAGLLVVYENLVSATQNFITQWNLATVGSGPTQLTFGTATSGTVNYAWQELSPGTASGGGSWSGATFTLTGLPAGATIRLQIAPTNFQRIIINNGLDRSRLTQVELWGTTAWTSMQDAFDGCTNLQVTATDVPDLLGVTNMSEMFRRCSNLNSPSNIGSWNTGAVTNMVRMFSGASTFNQNIGAWNTGAVTTMQEMFSGASVFNQNIGTWNTGAVTAMDFMFYQAFDFNQNIGAWNTSAVTSMSTMFSEAASFNQNIGAWNTGTVTDMSGMFQFASAFNQNIGSWNTATVTKMEFMFSDAIAFNNGGNSSINNWSTGAVTGMRGMFFQATAFNQNIGAWNTAAVTEMRFMFYRASAFNQNIGTWTLNPGVNLTSILDDSGVDCNKYSATLLAWSSNPLTPNSRTLGAIGRQYGTNAVAARTNLASTKGWTIAGDTPSGAVCAPSVPTITSFTPTSGPVGITVTITGTNFSTTPTNNTVQFNGTTAVVTASTATSIATTVPVGTTTGTITVTVGGNTAASATNFTVTASPIITITTQPSDFIACVGQTATFTTAATGTTNIIYQWQFSSDGIVPYTDIVNGGGYSNATTATLSVNTTANFGLGRYRCRINGDFAPEIITTDEGLFINPISNAPTVVGANRCGAGSVTLTASGGTNGQYLWYTTATGGTAIAGETNGTYVTPSITSTTSYYVSLNTNGCESTRTLVTATLTITPAPTATGVSGCPASAVTLNASGGTNGQYNWYTVATGGTAIAGEVNSIYQIPSLTSSTTFFVSLTISGCESTRTPVTSTLLSTGCAPVITTQTLTTQVEGKIEINLQSLITTPGTLDPTSIKVITQPASGALASISNFLLTIDYKGKPFSGKETIIIEACNTNSLCTQQSFNIEVAGDIVVYNAVSPNGDKKNDYLMLQYIDMIADTKTNQVKIYNRWGDEVFSIADYNNVDRVFVGLTNDGSKLPAGTYFYKIALPNAGKTLTGFIDLRY